MKKLIFLGMLFFICSNFIFGQFDPPKGHTKYYGFRLYEQGARPGADSINQNYVDIDRALNDLQIYLSEYFILEADSVLYPSDSFWSAIDSAAGGIAGIAIDTSSYVEWKDTTSIVATQKDIDNFMNNLLTAYDTVASATNIILSDTNNVVITGTTNIDSMDVTSTLINGQVIYVEFTGVLTLTNAKNLRLGGNITTAPYDVYAFQRRGNYLYRVR